MNLQRRSVLAGMAATAVCPICLARGAVAEEHAHEKHWTYEGEEGPAHWGELKPDFKSCAIGTQQSPIDLTKPIKAELAKLDIQWKEIPLTVTNNGHTIQVNVPPGNTVTEVGGEKYTLKQFHFHHPSEHLVDGKSYSMEVHFVHLNDAGTAAIVLGAFIVAGKENEVISKIWANLPKEAGEQKTELKIDPTKLLPKKHDRYRYEGSLTTPPCSEIIHWNVFHHSITASDAQIKQFAELFPNNARPASPLMRRFLLEG